MSINSLNSSPYSALQDALEAARGRDNRPKAAPVKANAKAETRAVKDVKVGTLYQKLYGGSGESDTKREVARGTRIDLYA